MSFHVAGPKCKGCEQMLVDVHPTMAIFFRWAKINIPSVHIAVGWRGRDAQKLAFEEGKSRAPWPMSKHNHTNFGKACSLALDLFFLGDDGVAHFDAKLYEELYHEAELADYKIVWGGNFKSLRDDDHFEMKT